jgi:hypothetical protein
MANGLDDKSERRAVTDGQRGNYLSIDFGDQASKASNRCLQTF